MNNPNVKVNSATVDLDPHNGWVTGDLEGTIETYKRAVTKVARDVTAHGFVSPLAACEYGVRASARIKVLEDALKDVLEGEYQPHLLGDSEDLYELLEDRSWKQAPIVEITGKWEEI